MWINDEEVVTLKPSGRRSVKKVTGDARLEAGWNSIRLTYIHAGKEPRLSIEMEGESFERQAIPSSLLSTSKMPVEPYKPYPLRSVSVEIGKNYFSRLGCGRCHDDIKVGSRGFIALSELNASKGCLSRRKGLWPMPHLWSIAWPVVAVCGFLLIARWKTAAVPGTNASEKLRRYGAMWQALYSAAWLMALDYYAQAAFLGAFAIAGFAAMTLIKEITGYSGRPLVYR